MAQLRNLGPASARMLAEAGVTTLADLQQLGAIRAYRRVRQLQRGKVSLNLLWALAAGLQDRDWRSLSREEKDSLRRELRAMG
ncbi:MAG: TfoX/Sxy family protein [Alphaproteobacteria bacterium]|nr:TfoX/Sxy family protein [Alphaproteobacteria bacterium]